MKNIDLGKITIPIDEYASEGNAILGIRDSGKSYTATAIAEKLMDSGIPIIAFDPIGIWRNLRVPGDGKGYKVVVAGGRNGDLPLTARGAQEIVRAAMRENVSLVVDLYDIHLSKADWREVVASCIRALLYENGDHGLRHIFIEEAAEFCPQVISPDQGRVYAEVEKLARMGGNALLGYTLINQRAEQVNKAVLELCDCMILHRQKGRNSITALSKWLDIASTHDSKALISSLPGLGQGDCWVWPAGADAPVRTKVPAKNSFHPDRRARHAPTATVTSEVDVSGFVATMRTSLEALTQEAEANDPKKLKARIAELERDKSAAGKPCTKCGESYGRGIRDGYSNGTHKANASAALVITDALKALKMGVQFLGDELTRMQAGTVVDAEFEEVAPATEKSDQQRRINGEDTIISSGGVKLNRLAERKVLQVLAVHGGRSKRQLAIQSGYAMGGGGFGGALSKLKSLGLIVTEGGNFNITSEGRKAIGDVDPLPTGPALVDYWMQTFDRRAEREVLRVVVGAYPRAMTAEHISQNTVPTYEHKGGGFLGAVSKLRTLGLIEGRGELRASDDLFDGGR